MFIAREKELETLEKLYTQKKLALAAVYGRSGMGKTALAALFARKARLAFYSDGSCGAA